ncbi:MAG: CopG family antitoxin [bacterium]|nr:CopG family antitoxin [bacterium]
MKKKISKIPQFKSKEEEARFFETHSISSFQNEFKTVKARFAKNLSEGLHIRLDPDALMELRSEAKEKGIGPTTLARMWIMKQLSSSRH